MAYNMDRWRELLPDGWRPSWLPQMPFTDYHQLNLDWIIETVKEWTERLIAFFDEDGAKDLVEDVLEEHPEWVTTVMDGSITKAKLNENLKVIQYNILDYEGVTLNKKWDAMRQSFHPWEYKQILIPYPREGNPACVKVGDDWKWKIDGPLVFTDKENCSTIEIYGELYTVAPVTNVLLFDDSSKPENIHFSNGIIIRGNRAAGNTIGCAIEIRAGARIDFSGEVVINDCGVGVLVGGDYQSAPAYTNFEYLSVGFFDDTGVHVKGTSYAAGLYADKMDLQVAQTANKDAVVIEGAVTPININYLTYGTDIAKDGYASYNARSALAIHGTPTADTHNINIGFIYATNADYGLYIDGTQTTHIYDVDIGFVGVGTANKTAVYARYAQFFTIERIKNNNSFDVQHCLYSNIFKGISESSDALDRFVGISGTVNIDTESAVNDVPAISNKNLGAITIVKTVNGTHAYINTGSENLIIDGQMFVPTVATLPAPTWQMRGKMYRVNSSDGQDIIAVCVKDTNAFKWFNIITQSFI